MVCGQGRRFFGSLQGSFDFTNKQTNKLSEPSFVFVSNVNQPVDFTSLRSQTTVFFLHFFTALILSTQTSSPVLVLPSTIDEPIGALLEQQIMKIASLPSLCEGILYFLTTSMGGQDWLETVGVEGRLERKVLLWGVEVMKDRLMMELDGRGVEED